jgi:hypothetical protein
MTVVLTVNICINDGLANGTQGILRQIVYEKDNIITRYSREEKSIILKKVPKYVVIELVDRTVGGYSGLPPNHVPIWPVKQTCVRSIRSRDGSKIQRRFQRYQLPLTPAFAFTDFKCQGRTLNKAVVDLAGGGTSTGMYVMLSRVQRLTDLLILRPFRESVLNMKIPLSLAAEFDRLDKCAQDTKKLERWP